MDCFHGYTLFLSVPTTREVGRNYLEEGACVIAGSCFFYMPLRGQRIVSSLAGTIRPITILTVH